ncbi:family 3 adenylate cyclase [Anabaena sp. WFMT]|uniref:family 3 adenylate cyclase n=1 Tax=Anabaena sp. WFMT TaxID=3449730 RepID=UPI003F205F26
MNTQLNTEKHSPALFDITQDIIGCLPLKLIKQWVESEKTPEIALQLLEAYKIKAYSVSSDSAGLTKLIKKQGLVKILAMINQSKEIIYSFGSAIGGQGIGIWTADNTQMLYPTSVSAERLLSGMLTIQRELSKNSQIKIGMGAHYGDFYYINGGLYGLEADVIEDITENETEGGEIVISQSLYELLPSHHNFTIVQRSQSKTHIGHIFRVLDGPTLSDLLPGDKKYPIPYTDAFYTDLVAYQNKLTDTEFCQQLSDKYLQKKVVVLIERETKQFEVHETALFINLSISAKLKEIGTRLLAQNNGEEINIVGSEGLYTFDEAEKALNFATAFRQELSVEGFSCRIGIDSGLVGIFDLPIGSKQIAGMPVNMASKMARDKGEFGKLYLSSNLKGLVDFSQCQEIKYIVSGVEVTAYAM